MSDTATGRTARSGNELAVYLICLLTVVSVVSWRRDTIFDGTIDTVVVIKAALSIAALIAAGALLALSERRHAIGARSFVFLLLILSVSFLGAYANETASAAAVVVVRVLILSLIVMALLASSSWRTVLSGILVAFGAIAVLAAVTGLPNLAASGRLSGGIPEMAANELAGLAAPPLVGLAILLFRDGIRIQTLVPAGVLAAIIWGTQSRTTLLAVAIAFLVALIVTPRVHWTAAAAMFASIPIGYAVIAYSSVLSDIVVRGQSLSDLASLNSRTVAWRVVFSWDNGSWERWLGLGLSVKQVPVQAQFRDVQVLDSSWVSSLAQTGVIGFVLLVVWAILLVANSISARDYRPIALPLVTLLLIRGFTENGMIDSSSTFLLFFVLAVSLEPATRWSEAAAFAPRPVRIPFRRTGAPATVGVR